jgi:hypothetical protein
MRIARTVSIFALATLIAISSFCSELLSLQDGDILFQDFPSSQSRAIKIATESEYSHCGIVFFEDDRPMVWEAVHPVKITPFKEWR